MTTAISTTNRGRIRSSGWLELGFVLGVLLILAYMYTTASPGMLGEHIRNNFDGRLELLVSVQFLVLVPAIFVIEHFFPARPEQAAFSPSVLFDALYQMIHMPAMAALTVVMAWPIATFLDQHASWLVVDSTRSWPLPLAALTGWIIADFGAYVVHRLKHKVPLFWRFHMIHHSQRNMNLFTSNRTHPVDALIDRFVLLIPFFVFFPSITQHKYSVMLIALIFGWQIKFEHSNIRTNLGPLRYILVSPQSHRIHHSTEPEHWNSNYSDNFAWDRLFGTQHSDVTSYPPTGINDPYFPEPDRLSPKSFACSFIGQLRFPFDREAVARASTGSPHRDSDRDRYDRNAVAG